ncbi:prolyl 4-hydroxylase [Seminavis robusta]|uniref:Prolyl 4-hydroxylase n=1 Tax=Seminavis robusta TaxID=568900 RepID=A0A9N8E309_9STRA|nr:prolyl 4-hydroxylase [Seminavis robusta]|eukprot:Sro475_g150410.1 prolyl 4-hydroxylase (567) ;mRNA; r:27734-29511
MTMASFSFLWLFAFLILLPLCHCQQRRAVSIQVINQSDRSVHVYYVAHPEQEDSWQLLSHPIVFPGSSLDIHKVRGGHVFAVVEETKTSPTLQFTASGEEEQVVTITPDWAVHTQDAHIRAQAEARQMLEDCKKEEKVSLLSCVQQKLQASVEHIREDVRFHNRIRKDVMANAYEDYACEDTTLETSEPLYRNLWHNPREDEDYEVSVLHDYSSSQIHLVEGFIDPPECEAIMEYSRAYLHRAKIHDGKGGNRFSEHRKAWQAGVQVPWHMPFHPISQLSLRVLEYTNHVLKLNLTNEGQEDLMSIQYFGPESDEEPPDRYMPHCDGPCHGRPHKRADRVATMVMYCEVPDIGGHTNFRNAGVHVQPTAGSAVFFSYVDPHTNLTDRGFTSHSGCPVYHGSKKIVTQWLRLGVDEDNPFDSFNTLGIQDPNYWDEDEEEEQDGERKEADVHSDSSEDGEEEQTFDASDANNKLDKEKESTDNEHEFEGEQREAEVQTEINSGEEGALDMDEDEDTANIRRFDFRDNPDLEYDEECFANARQELILQQIIHHSGRGPPRAYRQPVQQ